VGKARGVDMAARHMGIGTQEIRIAPLCSSPASRSDVHFGSCFAAATTRICGLREIRACNWPILEVRPLLCEGCSREKGEWLALLPRNPCHGTALPVTRGDPVAK